MAETAGGSAWQRYFQNWPKDVPTRGIVVTSFGDQVPFDGFLSNDGMLLLERKTPDNMGARKVLMAFQDVLAVKFVDLIRGRAFESAGFAGKLKD
ncbi:MAG TPA: hypothetical protein VNH11_06340 [Pirellulales bacterium]|nr:hypothetical protein [Pirellulales bacterium]